jgi:hypothetical protein
VPQAPQGPDQDIADLLPGGDDPLIDEEKPEDPEQQEIILNEDEETYVQSSEDLAERGEEWDNYTVDQADLTSSVSVGKVGDITREAAGGIDTSDFAERLF